MARMVLTNAEMQALINAGQDVLYKGRTIKNIADLPDDAQILLDYPEYSYNRIEGNAKAILGYQIYGTPSDNDTLIWSNANKRWEFGAGGGGGGSLTVREVDGTPSTTATTLEFDQADGFVMSIPSSGVARLKLSGIPWAAVSKSGSSVADLADKAATNLVMSTGKILGRTTGATGSVEELSLGSGLSLSAGVLSAVGIINNGTSGKLPVYVGSNALDDSDLEYSTSADWKFKIKTETAKSGLLVSETASTPPSTVLSAPVLSHFHVINGSTYWSIGYSSDATSSEWANYLADDGSLVFVAQDGLESGTYAYYNDGLVYNKAGSSILGGIGTVSANKYGLLLTSNTPTSGQSYSFIWDANGVTQALPASAMADGNILNGQLHFYQDEATNELKAKWKESGGTVNTITFSSGGSPGGSSGQFQFNSSGSFGGTTGVTYASSGSPTVSITGQSASQTTALFTSAAASSSAVIVARLGASGSSGDLFQAQNNGGTALMVVDATGAIGAGITSSLLGRIHGVGSAGKAGGFFQAAALDVTTVLVARQGSSSVGNLFETQTSGGTVQVSIDNNGTITETRNSVGTGSLDGLVIQNTTAAAAGSQQYSPFLRLRGYGWKTDATAESRPVDMGWQVLPAQGAANPSGEMALKYSINGAAYTTGVSFTTSNFVKFAQTNSTNFAVTMFGGGDFSNGSCGWQNPGNNNVWSLACPPAGPVAIRFSRGGAGYYTRIDLLNSNATSLQLGTGGASTAPFAFTTNYFTFDTSNVMLIAHQPLRLDSWGVFTEISVPATPAANTVRLYAKDSGGLSKLAYKDDAGTEYELGTAVPRINTSGLGYSIPGQGGTVFLGDSNSQVVGSANQVRVLLFYIDRTITVDRIGLNGVLDEASQNAAFAIYSVDGNTKIADSGAISTAAWSGAANYALSGTATFGPGYYYFAWTASSTTPTVRSASAATNYYAPLNNGTGTVIGTAANTSTAGAMPATLGAITDDATLAVPLVRWFKN